MGLSFTGKKRIRKTFGRIPETVAMPNHCCKDSAKSGPRECCQQNATSRTSPLRSTKRRGVVLHTDATHATRKPMLYTITGANGFIACSLVKHLVSLGHTVRGTVRDATKDGEYLKSLGASVVEIKDLSDVEALASAFKGCDGVFHMAAVHPEYGFAETPEGRAGILATAVANDGFVISDGRGSDGRGSAGIVVGGGR